MMTDTEIRVKGMTALSTSLGSVEAERFISLVLREPFDYTRWQSTLFRDQSLEALSESATKHRNQQAKQEEVKRGRSTL
jgi:hypothetical protein